MYESELESYTAKYSYALDQMKKKSDVTEKCTEKEEGIYKLDIEMS